MKIGQFNESFTHIYGCQKGSPARSKAVGGGIQQVDKQLAR